MFEMVNNMEIKIFEQINKDSIDIRNEVFVKEQKFEVEFDEIDSISKHIVLYLEDKAIGTCRVYKEDNDYIIGRVAVLKKYRTGGYGKIIVLSAIDLVKELDGKVIRLSAQTRVKDFYKKIGFKEYGEEYLDEYCAHISMILEL